MSSFACLAKKKVNHARTSDCSPNTDSLVLTAMAVRECEFAENCRGICLFQRISLKAYFISHVGNSLQMSVCSNKMNIVLRLRND